MPNWRAAMRLAPCLARTEKRISTQSSLKALAHGLFLTGGLAGDALQTAVANVALSLLGFTTGILAARLLGPTGRGELAAIQSWPAFLATLSTLGLGEALVYYAAGDPDGTGRFLGSAVTTALAACVPVIAVGFLLMPFLLAAQPPGVIACARWYLLLAPLYVLTGMPIQSLRAKKQFAIWNALRSIPQLLWLAVLGIAWALRQDRASFVAAAQLVSLVLLCVPVWLITAGRLTRPVEPRLREWRPMLRFGLPSITANVPQMLNLRLDQMLMAALMPPRLLGLYAVAVAWSAAGQGIPRALGMVNFPHVAALADRPEQQKNVFARTVRLSVVLAVTASLALLGCTPWALPLVFGRSFRASVPSAIVLVVAAGILGINTIVEEGMRGLGRPAMVLWAEVAGLGMTGSALWLLLPRIGIMGAALASLLGYATVGAVLIAQARMVTRLSVAALLLPSRDEIRTGIARAWSLLHGPVSAPG